MNPLQSFRLLVQAVVLAPLPLAAQPAPTTAVSPAAPSAVESPRSAMAGFRRWQPDQPGPGWRAANDEMGRLGGHIGQARAPTASPTAPGTAGAAVPPLQRPKGADHADHHGSGAAR